MKPIVARKTSALSLVSELDISFVGKLVKQKFALVQLSYNTLIKEVKHTVMREAVEFIKQQASALTKLLTNDHHRLIK